VGENAAVLGPPEEGLKRVQNVADGRGIEPRRQGLIGEPLNV
jgi:hypothetical protein